MAKQNVFKVKNLLLLVSLALLPVLYFATTSQTKLFSRASTSTIDALWSSAKPANGNLYPWSNGGPTTGWESYMGGRVYVCNGEWCWMIERNNTGAVLGNNGSAFQLSQQEDYKNARPAPDGTLPWSNGGPTAAWTWVLPYQGHTVNESLICNGYYCWRYLRYPNGVPGSGLRDGGAPLNMKDAGVWKDDEKMWAGGGLSAGWNDPINQKATLCNRSQNYCRSMSYKNNTWAWLTESVQYPPGVSSFTSAWTSPVTNWQSRCFSSTCYIFVPNNSGGGSYNSGSSTIGIVPTNTPKIAQSPTNTPKATSTPSPCMPTLINPGQQASVSQTVNFRWSGCDTTKNRFRYKVRIIKGQTRTDRIIGGNSLTIRLQKGTYDWAAAACLNGPCDLTTNWASMRTFKVR